METTIQKRPGKEERTREVLFGLIRHYLKTGRAVGSETLKEDGFDGFSSATIRNYFSTLEEEGYLKQLHTSGGRVPTEKAYRLFAEATSSSPILSKETEETINRLKENDSPEVSRTLQQASELLSQATSCATFLLAPRFDQDFILDVKLVPIDNERALACIITNFGLIHTELLLSSIKLNNFRIKRIESYFLYRLTGLDKPDHLEEEEFNLAKTWYGEVMLRYVIGGKKSEEDLFRTGFSKLLHYPEMENGPVLSKTLSLFENVHGMRLLLKETMSRGTLKFWLGHDLAPYAKEDPNCSVIAIPYAIGGHIVGAVGILGPMRLSYPHLFGALHHFSEVLSDTLTKTIYKYRITYQETSTRPLELASDEHLLLDMVQTPLLEDQSQGNYV